MEIMFTEKSGNKASGVFLILLECFLQVLGILLSKAFQVFYFILQIELNWSYGQKLVHTYKVIIVVTVIHVHLITNYHFSLALINPN